MLHIDIKVGDIVTWRDGKSRKPSGIPLGIANCKVLLFGEAKGQPAVLLALPHPFNCEAGAFVSDLEKPE